MGSPSLWGRREGGCGNGGGIGKVKREDEGEERG
jgi:hypothetical protein